jgi:hypothetical protein
MSLRIAAAESTAAIILVLDIDDDFESGGPGSGIDCISVGNDEVGSLGFFSTDICRLANIPAMFVIHD